MLPDELEGFYGSRAIERSVDLNPLRVAESYFFDQPTLRHVTPRKDYREQAIESVCKHKLPFRNTANSTWELMRQFVKVTCPYCGDTMKHGGGGGNGTVISTNYECSTCKAKVGITLGDEHFGATPPPVPHRALSWVLKLKDIDDPDSIRRNINRGKCKVNGKTIQVDREVKPGDTIEYNPEGGIGATGFTVNEHDVTAQPKTAGGTFTK